MSWELLGFFNSLIFLSNEKINCNQIVNEIVSEDSNQQESRQEILEPNV